MNTNMREAIHGTNTSKEVTVYIARTCIYRNLLYERRLYLIFVFTSHKEESIALSIFQLFQEIATFVKWLLLLCFLR